MTPSSDRAADHSKRHFTTRRGFLAAASLGTVSLYGAWAWLGAVPIGIGAHHDHGHGDTGPTQSAGHGGHGQASGPSIEEFRRQTDDFIARYRQSDGSVRPHRADAASSHDAHAGHGAAPAPNAAADRPIEVYIAAAQWAFEPAVLRLEAGVAYRFRMMAIDASHGAAFQLGTAGHVIRLRRGVLVERDLTFTHAGEHLLYCTLFCGIGHDRMAGRLIVT